MVAVQAASKLRRRASKTLLVHDSRWPQRWLTPTTTEAPKMLGGWLYANARRVNPGVTSSASLAGIDQPLFAPAAVAACVKNSRKNDALKTSSTR